MLDEEAAIETEEIRILIRIMNVRDAIEQAKLAGAAWQTRVIWFEAQEQKLMKRYEELTGE